MSTTPLPLKALHLPEAITWWPPALGWWLLLATALLLGAIAFWVWRIWRRRLVIKAAKSLLWAIRDDNALDNKQKLQQISALLRRVALNYHPRQQVAGLTGRAWLEFLDATLPDKPFSTGAGAYLADAPYQPRMLPDQQLAELIALSAAWLEHCGRKTHIPPGSELKSP